MCLEVRFVYLRGVSADTATVCALSSMRDTHAESPPVRGLYPPAMGRDRRAPCVNTARVRRNSGESPEE